MSHHYPRNDSDSAQLAQGATRLPRRLEAGVDDLLAENEQLRSLIVELSRIVARNALERK